MRHTARILILVLLLSLVPGKAAAAELKVAGKSGILMDVATGTVLWESNAHERLAPASVTKVMTMLLIMEAVDSGKIALTDTVTASEAAAAKGGSQVYLKVGETMSVSEMLKCIAVSSANDCACAMAEHIAGSEEAFVGMMNARAKELGMLDTNFVNCTGLDDSPNASEHKTSAHDIALMSRELMKNHPGIKQYTTIWMDSIRNGSFGLSKTNKLVRFYQGATGLKTGFTSGAGYCLSATAQREDLELIAVIMGADTGASRNAACKQLLDYGFANYALVSPELTETPDVAVTLGKVPSVSLRLGENGQLLIDKGQKSSVTTRIRLQEPVDAPVSQGQRLGTMEILVGEQILSEIPLVAAEAVPRLTWGDLFLEVLKRAAMAKTEKPTGSEGGFSGADPR